MAGRKEIAVVRVAAGMHKGYAYHELRIVAKDVGGGHYANSVGCVILRRSGPRRGTIRLEAEYRAEARVLQAALDSQYALAAQDTQHWASDPDTLALCLSKESLW